MKHKKPKNPLKIMEDQIDGILFNNEKIKPMNNDKYATDDKNNSIKEMKDQLICLVKELKAKNLYLVA